MGTNSSSLQENKKAHQGMNGKRLPKSKSGRLLIAVRDHIISEAKKNINNQNFSVPRSLIQTVDKLNERINSRIAREQEPEPIKQIMLTDSKSIIEYRDKGMVIRASFTGSITEAKANLIQQRRRESIKEELPVFLWGHQTKGNGLLIHGMWIESVLVK